MGTTLVPPSHYVVKPRGWSARRYRTVADAAAAIVQLVPIPVSVSVATAGSQRSLTDTELCDPGRNVRACRLLASRRDQRQTQSVGHERAVVRHRLASRRPTGPALVARRAVESLGGRYSTQLGIDVDRGGDEIERWALPATLFGARISAKIAERTFAVLEEAGVHSLADAGRRDIRELVELLDAGGYARYDLRTAERLHAIARKLDARWSRRVNRVLDLPSDELWGALDALPGWGQVTVGLFLRELRGVRPEIDPPAGRTRAPGRRASWAAWTEWRRWRLPASLRGTGGGPRRAGLGGGAPTTIAHSRPPHCRVPRRVAMFCLAAYAPVRTHATTMRAHPPAGTRDQRRSTRASRRRATAFAWLAISGLLALSGCGGGAGPGKSAYIAKANAICQRASSQTAPLIKQVTSLAGSLTSGSSSAAQRLAGTLGRLHTAAAGSLAQLQRLKQPSGDHAAIERFLTPLGRVVDAIGKAAVAVGSGQVPAALGLLEQAGPVAEDATAAAQAYGMRQCETVLAALG